MFTEYVNKNEYNFITIWSIGYDINVYFFFYSKLSITIDVNVNDSNQSQKLLLRSKENMFLITWRKLLITINDRNVCWNVKEIIKQARCMGLKIRPIVHNQNFNIFTIKHVLFDIVFYFSGIVL